MRSGEIPRHQKQGNRTLEQRIFWERAASRLEICGQPARRVIAEGPASPYRLEAEPSGFRKGEILPAF